MAENHQKEKEAQVEVEELRFRLQELEEIFNATLNQTGEAIVVCDATGRIIRFTSGTHELCGCDPAGARFDDLFALTRADGKPFYATGALRGEHHRMLAEDHTSKLDAEGLRLLRVVQDNSQLMGRLIDDLLALSRLGRQELKMRGVDLSGLAETVFQELQVQNPHRTLNLIIKELPQAYGDRGLLRQVLVNLLQNAVTFTQPKKRAQIEVGGWTEGKEAVYYIKDNGVGFNMKYADKLFGVFQTLHRRKDFEGTGVGPAIVQRIIYRHGGRVWAEGKVNEGATFYFSLPDVPH